MGCALYGHGAGSARGAIGGRGEATGANRAACSSYVSPPKAPSAADSDGQRARERGIAAARSQAWSRARPDLRAAAASGPPDLEVLLYLGVASLSLGELTEAREAFAAMTRHFPTQSVGHYNLGVVLFALQDLPGAEACYREEIRLAGPKAQGFANLGLILHGRGAHEEAREVYRQGLAARAGDGSILRNLAQLDLEDGRAAAAAAGLALLLRSHPEQDDLRVNLGVARMQMGHLREARAIFEEVLGRNPKDPSALHNLGSCLVKLKQPAEAATVLERALGIASTAQTFETLHVAYRDAGDNRGAARTIEAGRARFPNDNILLVEAACWLPRVYTDDAEVQRHRRRFLDGVVEIAAAAASAEGSEARALLAALDRRNNFSLPYQGELDVPAQTTYGRAHTELAQRCRPQPSLKRRHNPRPRVGWVSSYFCRHTIAKLFGGFVTHLDRARFEPVVFHLGAHTDDVTGSLGEAAELHHIPFNLNAVVDYIRGRELDVLIFTDVGMDAISQGLAARRLAPVQAVMAGHPQTTGYPNIDYFLSGEDWEPPDGASHYSEDLHCLPGAGVFFVPPPPAAPVPRARFGLSNDAVLYLSAQSLFKYMPRFDDAYMAILKEVPEAELAFLRGPAEGPAHIFAARLREAGRRMGIDVDGRVHLLPRMSEEDFGRIHQCADVLLDSMPFSSFTSLLEAWAHSSIPTVARAGRFMRERTAAALLAKLGLDEWVSADGAGFTARAIALGQDRDLRQKVRARIDETKSVLYDDMELVKALERHIETWVK